MVMVTVMMILGVVYHNKAGTYASLLPHHHVLQSDDWPVDSN